jgi:hypothetical protein
MSFPIEIAGTERQVQSCLLLDFADLPVVLLR